MPAMPASPADEAGLQQGDIIVALGGMEVADLYGLTDALRAHRHLTAAATAWQDRERDPNELYRGARLEAFEALPSNASIALNDTEQAFLRASIQRRDEEADAERQRVQRLHRLDEPVDLDRVEALIEAGRPGQVPAVEREVERQEAVDCPGEGPLAEHALVGLLRAGGVAQVRHHLLARDGDGLRRVLVDGRHGVQFAVDACPKAAIYGRAEAVTPLLDDPALLAFALNGVFMQTCHRTGLAPQRDRACSGSAGRRRRRSRRRA